MKKLLLSFVCLSMLYATRAQQQDPHRSYIGVSMGWQRLTFLDRHASPLTYRAKASPYYGLSYHKQRKRTLFDLKLSGGYGTADPKLYGPRNYAVKWSETAGFEYQISSEFFTGNLQAAYLFKLGKPSLQIINFWVGGVINESVYYADEVASNPWVINMLDFSPAFRVDYAAGDRHRVTIQGDYAVIGAVTRIPYGLFAKSNKDKNVPALLKQGTNTQSVKEYQKLNVDITYTFRATNRIGIGAEYSFRWFHDTKPQPVSAVDSRTNINLKYLFR